MLVPKCALSQFANWDLSLRTGISVCELRFIYPSLRTEPQFPNWDLSLRTDTTRMETKINKLIRIWKPDQFAGQ